MSAWEWWGASLPYAEGWERQRRRRDAVRSGVGADCLALLSHRSVITTGRRVAPGTATAEELALHGIDYFRTERGGLATWHGPGQLVGYLVYDLSRLGVSIRCFVHAIEEGVIRWLRREGVAGHRRDRHPGVWVGGDKICAIGLNVDRGVTLHGFALNLCPDLSAYRFILPCGIRDAGVTTLELLTGSRKKPKAVAAEVADEVIGAIRQARLTARAPLDTQVEPCDLGQFTGT